MNEAETSAPVQDGAASQETQQDSSQVEAGVDTGTGSQEAQTDEPGSSTNPDTTSQTPKPDAAAAPQRDWQAELAKAEKQAADWRAKHNQSSNQLHDYRTKYEGVDPQAVRQWKEQQAKAERENLPVWNRQHPNNQGFQQVRSKFALYQSAMQKAETPEERAVLQKTLGAQFTQQDAEQIKAFDEHRAKMLDSFATDPEGTIEEIVDRRVQSRLKDEQMTMQATSEVEGWMTAPENKDIVTKYGPQMLDALRQGNNWAFVRQMAIDRAKLEGLQSRVGPADKAAAQARAQSDLAKRKATHSRDGAVKPQRDIAAEVRRVMKEKGWRHDHPGVIELIERLQATTAI